MAAHESAASTQTSRASTLSHLLVLDGLGELVAKGEVGDGHVVHDEVELLGAVRELVTDAGADRLTLAEELLCVVLGHDGLEHLRVTVLCMYSHRIIYTV